MGIGAERLTWHRASDLEHYVQDKLADVLCHGENLLGEKVEEKADFIEKTACHPSRYLMAHDQADDLSQEVQGGNHKKT